LTANANVLLVTAALMWSGNAIAGKMAVGEWESFTLTMFRWLFTLLFLLPFVWRHLQRDWPVLRQNMLLLLAMGACGMGAFHLCLYTALHYTSAINASIEQSLMPVLIILANFLIFKQRVRTWQLVGVALSICGAVVTATHGQPWDFFRGAMNRGDAIMLLGALFYAGYTISLRWRPSVNWLSFLFVVGCGAMLVCLPLSLWEINAKGFTPPSTKGWLVLLYTIIFATMVSQLAFARGVVMIGANRAGLFINLVPVFSSVLAVLLIGETFQLYHAIGMVLVVGGILLAERSALQ